MISKAYPSTRKPWFVIVGPTAVGKSQVTEILALELKTEILVADSMQIYRGMDIATEKPPSEARRRVHRHLIDLIPPDQPFSAGAYKRAAEAVIAERESRSQTILIEGGSGLYLKALLDGLWEGPHADWELRNTLLEKEKEEGEGTLHRVLQAVDPTLARKIHCRDLHKIIRALEVHSLTGRRLSEFHEEHRHCASGGPSFWMLGLRRDRKDLIQRIEKRVDRQISSGLIEETEGLLASGYSRSLPSMLGLGYRQIVAYLEGEYSQEEAVSLLKRDVRRYSKRQMTWFRADTRIEWLDLAPDESVDETVGRIRNLKNYEIML
ncbi:MAG: tRNA (adenosine(37)-N6)-dimethylallyltransferase MiaA [Nitrospiria bacterium]